MPLQTKNCFIKHGRPRRSRPHRSAADLPFDLSGFHRQPITVSRDARLSDSLLAACSWRVWMQRDRLVYKMEDFFLKTQGIKSKFASHSPSTQCIDVVDSSLGLDMQLREWTNGGASFAFRLDQSRRATRCFLDVQLRVSTNGSASCIPSGPITTRHCYSLATLTVS